MRMKGRWLYVASGTILFLLAVVCMVSFIKAVSAKDVVVEKQEKVLSDSLQVEFLRLEVNALKTKIDSLITISQQGMRVKYKYLKPRKDSCVIELNVNTPSVNN